MNDLSNILCWRETRRVSQQLVVHYNRMKFTLHPTDITARLVGQEVEVYDFPDGRLEIRWKGLPLAYAVFDSCSGSAMRPLWRTSDWARFWRGSRRGRTACPFRPVTAQGHAVQARNLAS